MRVTYRNHTIYNTDGSSAGVLDGQYDATPLSGQQPGWYALRKILPNGSVHPQVVANVHIGDDGAT